MRGYREDAARALCGAREAVTRRHDAHGARRCARQPGGARCAAQDARATALALDLLPRLHRIRRHDERIERTTRDLVRAFYTCAAGDRCRAGFGGWYAQVAASVAGRSTG